MAFSAVLAQPSPPIAERIREIGAVLNPKMVAEMFALYAPLMPKASGSVMREDVAYGPDERHRLDVFGPAARIMIFPPRLLPVVVFVPGGGYVGGGKSRAGTPFYQNVGNFFARNGVVAVTMNYRLAPRHPWPAGGEDVAAALRWVKANIRDYGGDPERITLFGQSAGATHVAHYIFDESLQPPGAADGVTGAVLQSGIFNPRAAPAGPNVEAYFGRDRDKWEAMSLYDKLEGRRIPVLIVTAEYDPVPFKEESAFLRDELCKLASRCPWSIELVGHNHLSEILHLNTDDGYLGMRLLEFMRPPR